MRSLLRLPVAVLAVVCVLALAACDKGDERAEDALENPFGRTTSSVPGPGKSLPNPQSTAPDAGDGTRARLTLTNFTGPASPVTCEPPTTDIRLAWRATGADTVELFIDGQGHESYPDGSQSVTVPLECDGQDHEYEVVARADGSTARQSLSIASG